jgi:hypothetical protein
MDQGLAYEQKVSGLKCSFFGAPHPPVVACPKPNELNSNLSYSVRYDSTDYVSWLLDCCASVDAKDRLGCTPLLAVTELSCGYKSSVNRGHPDSPNGDEVPMMSSRDSLSLDGLLKILLDHGADLEAKDPANGETPLIKLVKYGNSSAAFDFITYHPSINAQDNLGNTALMLAAASGNDILVRPLLYGKPDLALKIEQGKTA